MGTKTVSEQLWAVKERREKHKMEQDAKGKAQREDMLNFLLDINRQMNSAIEALIAAEKDLALARLELEAIEKVETAEEGKLDHGKA